MTDEYDYDMIKVTRSASINNSKTYIYLNNAKTLLVYIPKI